MGDTNEQFIRIFESLKSEVNRRADAPSSGPFQIALASDQDVFVKRHRDVLKYIADVRNRIQHPKHRSLGHAFNISETFLEETKSLLESLKNPPTAHSIGVPRRDIRNANLTDPIGELADAMKSGGFSHLPILDDNDILIGIFNEAAVFAHIGSEAEVIVGRQTKVSEIFNSCRLDADHTETFRFVSPKTTLNYLVEMFSALGSPTTRIGAAFVTPSGKAEEPIHRLITPWDVLSMSENK